MCCSKGLLSFGVLLVFATFANSAVAEEMPCPIRYKCSQVEEVVWASDGKECQVFRNNCHLANQNCQRKNRHAEELKVVPKEECQKLCPDMCTMDYNPVCSEYNGAERTFSSECMLSMHICQSGETYSLPVQGECQHA